MATVTGDQAKLDTLVTKARTLEPPQINSIPVFESTIQPNRDEAILGFRFMGQRFTVDASIFQRLLCREVGRKNGSMECGGSFPDSRMLPKGLDIPAAMGSTEAKQLLTSLGETQYKNYPENLAKLQEYVSGFNEQTWTQNLYWTWLYALKPLTVSAGNGYPSFMRSSAWDRKSLQAYLGSWTELKHDTILYAKQVYAELGGGPPDEHDDRGYVEPYPDVYARLAALAQLTSDGLDQRDLLSSANKDSLARLQALALKLKAISEKELNATELTKDEYDTIRTYGGELEHLWQDVNKDAMAKSGLDQNNYLSQNPAALVADVATDPNGVVLEEANR